MYKTVRRKVWAFIERRLDKKIYRAGILVATAGIAYCFVGEWGTGFLEGKFPIGDERNNINQHLLKIFAPAAYSAFVFLALWWFRTIDARQAIYQTNLGTGLNMLASDAPIKIEMAVLMLERVSKSTTVFDEEISLAFIKRLKRSPQNSLKNRQRLKDGYRWAYAQYILQWLKDRGKGWDLRYLDLRGQEFTGDSVKVTYKDIKDLHDCHRYGDDLPIEFGGCRFIISTEKVDETKAAERFFGCYQSIFAMFTTQDKTFFKCLESKDDKSQPPTS